MGMFNSHRYSISLCFFLASNSIAVELCLLIVTLKQKLLGSTVQQLIWYTQNDDVINPV
jgi:hypothetical protein